ncbi:hypothetical protein [Endozoicomonas sp. Mp262]|uniref:hypothetical protein n=1 Tax=Endozoicomonas sp. Mp262 TaxID=2919499 RepID=UPI0021D8CB05
MSHYDLLVGLNQERLNLVVTEVYGSESLKQSLFSGGESGAYSGVNYSLKWSVDQAPELSLRAPASDEWGQAIKEDGKTVAPQSGAFIVDINKLSLKLTTDSDSLDTTVPVKAICTAGTHGSALAIDALAVIVNLSQSSEMDRFVIGKVLIPALLKMLNQSLSGIQLPKLSFASISLTPPVVGIKDGYLLAAFNLVKDGTPSIENITIPGDPFFALLSQELMQSTVDYEVRKNIQGKTFNKSGSEGAAGFSASYHAWGKINSISVATTSNSTELHAKASLAMSASAGIDTPVGIVTKAIAEGAEKVGKAIINPDTWNPSKW